MSRDTFSTRRNTFGGGMNDAEEAQTPRRVSSGGAAVGGPVSAHAALRRDIDDELLAENQEALFPYFDIIIAHMARVRKATTCAQRLLESNAQNCRAFNESHLNQIVALMVDGSARYSWYMDTLLSLARSLPDVDSQLPLKIMRKLLAAPNGYLLVLYEGTTGRENRARELASASGAQLQSDTGMVAFHHALVQLLAELSSGLANEVEMYVQSIVPLHEACAHICDAFCPYAIRASFFVLLLEGYTVTALKVQSLVQSPAVWQVVAIFVSELRSLLECIAGHGDEDDRAQAILSIRASKRGPSFIEAGLWFCVAFLQKHVSAENLQADHKACLANLQHLSSRLLNIERARNRAAVAAAKGISKAAVERVSAVLAAAAPKPKDKGAKACSKATLAAMKSKSPGAAMAEEKSANEQVAVNGAVEADAKSPGARTSLSLGPHQLTLFSAVVQALTDKGIGAGSSAWRNLGLRAGLKSVTRSVAAQRSGGGSGGGGSGGSAHARARQQTLVDAKHRDPSTPSNDEDGEGALGGEDGSDEGDWLVIERDDGGLEVASKIAAAVEAARSELEAWEAQEFNRSVLIFKENDEAIRPIIDQLNGASESSIQERCLKVLQALLRADTSLQVMLNDMGVTAVMLHTLAAPSSVNNFQAALELGIALLDGGNRTVQRTIFEELSSSGSNNVLSSLVSSLNRDCHKIQLHFLEGKQQTWYNGVLEPHVKEATAPRPLRLDDKTVRRGSVQIRGSGAALSRAVADAQQRAADARKGFFEADAPSAIKKKKKASLSSMDSTLASLVLVLIECVTEEHYAEMQDFLRVQRAMRTQVNVVIELVNNLLVLERTLSASTISLTSQVYQTLIELVQGPCPDNQRFLIGTNLCDVAVRFMHGNYPDCQVADVIELKLLCLKMLLAMVEGVQSDRAIIPRRIASSLDYSRLVGELDSAYALSGGDIPLNAVRTQEQLSWQQLGFYFFLLIRTLAKYSPAVLELAKAKAKSYPFFARNTGAIEIVRADKSLEEVYFPIPKVYQWLSEKSKQKLEWEVDRSTPQKRIEDFVNRSEGMIQEMRHNERVAAIPILYMLAVSAENLHLTMFILSTIINMIILLATFPDEETHSDGSVGQGYWDVQFRPHAASYVVYTLGVAQVLVSCLSLIEHCISTMPMTLRQVWGEHGVSIDFPEIWPLKIDLKYTDEDAAGESDDDNSGGKEGDDEDGEGGEVVDIAEQQAREKEKKAKRDRHLRYYVSVWTPLLLLQTDTWLQYYTLFYIPSCIAGLLFTPFCFVITLLDIVVRSRLLQKVIEAVTVNIQALTLTFLLVGVVTYHFTIIGQLYFRDDFNFNFLDAAGNHTVVDLCASTGECLMNTFYLGMSYGGFAQGLSDIREQWDTNHEKALIRWVIDLLFYISVLVLLLNIIFGIVIDTFAQQRDLQNQIKDNMENVCFVCGIDRNTFDRKHPIGFEYHIEHEHNIWHYLSFTIHLEQKSVTEKTGPESYVAEMLKSNNLTFYPILKASSIVLEDNISNESLLVSIEQLSQTTQQELANANEALQRVETEQKMAAERVAGPN